MEAFAELGTWEIALPILAMVAGIAASLLMMRTWSQSDEQVEAESRRIDLQSTVDDSIEVLRALEIEQGKMDPAEYTAEREAVLARGAKAMEALEGGSGELAEAPVAEEAPAPEPVPDSSPEAAPASASAPVGFWESQTPLNRGLITAGVALAVLAMFVVFAGQGSTKRLDGMSMTGGEIVNQDQARAQQEVPAALQALLDRVEADPNDIEALNTLTGVYLNAQQAQPAMQYNEAALEADAKNHTARAYRGMLTLMMGMSDRALEQIDGVLAENPEHELAATYKGLFLMHMKRYAEAVPALEKAQALLPTNQGIQSALTDARALAAGERPPSQGELIVSGTMQLAPGTVVTGQETVFLSVKSGSQPGPPVAATRLPARFPAPFEINTTNVQAMGGSTEVPESLTLTIRVDRDGNAMTREDAPIAEVQVAKGTSDLVVTLAGGSAPAPAPSAAAPAGGGGEVLVSGTASLPAGVSAAGQVLYISLKSPSGGPPFAAIRRTNVSFPYAFELTSGDLIPMMAGRPLPDSLSLSVRLDKDGDPMSNDGEPQATLAVTKGTTGVAVTLQ